MEMKDSELNGSKHFQNFKPFIVSSRIYFSFVTTVTKYLNVLTIFPHCIIILLFSLVTRHERTDLCKYLQTKVLIRV